MQITIYLDVIFLVNFIANFFVLLITGKIIKKKIRIWRVTLGAMFGAVLLLFFMFLPSWLMGWKGIVTSVGISMGAVAIPYGEKNFSFVRTWFLSTTIMVLIGGTMNYIRYIYETSVLQLMQWLFVFGVSSLCVLALLSAMRKTVKANDHIYLIQIRHGNRTIVESVYLDTGNLLMDPIFHKPVLVLCENVVNQCLIEDEKIILEHYKKNGRLDYNSVLSCQTQKNICFHEISYQSVGQTSGKLLCVLLDQVCVLGKDKVLRKQPVAIVPEAVFSGKEYKGLLHKECI